MPMSLARPPPRALLGGYGADNESATAAGWQRCLRPSNGGSDERFHLGTRQDIHRFQANEAGLIARAKEELVGVGKSRAMDEAQADAVGPGCHRDNAIRRPFGRAVADDEKVVV